MILVFMEDILFFKEFIKNWREVGAITPSSKFLVKKMLQSVDFRKAALIVELGSGSGTITINLLKKMRKDGKLIIFETNKDFGINLKNIKDSRLTIYNESALNLEKRLFGQSPDYIISGIPLATLSQRDKKSLLFFSNKVLSPNGLFIQFQYSLESLKDLKDVFDIVTVDFTPLNIPPAFVFSCVKK